MRCKSIPQNQCDAVRALKTRCVEMKCPKHASKLNLDQTQSKDSHFIHISPTQHIASLISLAASMSAAPVTTVLPIALGLSNEAFDAMLDTVKHYSALARNVITHSNSLPTTPPRVSPIQQRRMACTHLTMKRQYGDYSCMICRKIPDIGWIYICTQDEEEMLEAERD